MDDAIALVGGGQATPMTDAFNLTVRGEPGTGACFPRARERVFLYD